MISLQDQSLQHSGDFDETAIYAMFHAFRRTTSTGEEARESSQKFLINTLYVSTDLLYMVLWPNKLIEKVLPEKGFRFGQKPRWMPTQAFKKHFETNETLKGTMAIKWARDHMREMDNREGMHKTPIACSRETINQILKAMEKLGILVKEPRTFGAKYNPSSTFDVNAERLLIFILAIERLYWVQRTRLEYTGKKFIELPRHMFRLAKEVYNWVFGVKYNARSKEAPEIDPVGQRDVLLAIDDEIGQCLNQIEIIHSELSQSHYLGLSQVEKQQLQQKINGKESLIDSFRRTARMIHQNWFT